MVKKIRMHIADENSQSIPMHPETTSSQVLMENTELNLSDVIGNISELETTNKNLVDAINENFTRVVNGKTLLASALTAKGVTVRKEGTIVTFEELVTAMDNLVYIPLVVDYYKYGEEYVDITGGWEVADLKIDLQAYGYTISKEPTYLHMNVWGQNNQNTVCGYRTVNTFDTTNVNKMYCEFELVQNMNYKEHFPIFYFTVRDAFGNTAHITHDIDDVTTLPKTIVLEIDVEKMDSANLKVSVLCPGTEFYRKEVKVKRIWGTS